MTLWDKFCQGAVPFHCSLMGAVLQRAFPPESGIHHPLLGVCLALLLCRSILGLPCWLLGLSCAMEHRCAVVLCLGYATAPVPPDIWCIPWCRTQTQFSEVTRSKDSCPGGP